MKKIIDTIKEKSNDYSNIEKQDLELTGSQLKGDPTSPHRKNISESVPTVSIIIPAWNASSTILSCLTAIEQSSFNLKYHNKLQVVVIDDGSKDDTWSIIENTSLYLHIIALNQKNCGQAKALNTGLGVAEGDIIISCDADMVLNYYAIEQFVIRHQILPNVLLVGFRTDILGSDTQIQPSYIREYRGLHKTCFKGDERISYPTLGWPQNMCLVSNNYKNLGFFRKLWMPDDETFEDPWLLPDLVFGALFSLSREDYNIIGGYDERLEGWGCSDSLVAAKSIANNNFIIPVYAASGFHISHPFRTEDKIIEYSENRKRFFRILHNESLNSQTNWIKKAKNRITKSLSRNPSQTQKSKDINSLTNNAALSKEDEIDNLLALQKYSQAYQILNNLSQKDSITKFKLAKILFGMEKYEDSISFLEEITITDENYIEISIFLATAQAALGNFASAGKIMKKLIQSLPKEKKLKYWHARNKNFQILQGKKYFHQRFYKTAIRCFEAALITDPGHQIAIKYRNKCIATLLNGKLN